MVSQGDLHESLSRAEELRPQSDRAFGITIAAALLILALVFAFHGIGAWLVALVLASAFLIVAAFAPDRLRPINRLWMRFGMVLHAIISPIVLFILFFAVITPTGVLARFLGKDFLRLKFDRNAPSYWIDRKPPGPRPESLRNQF